MDISVAYINLQSKNAGNSAQVRVLNVFLTLFRDLLFLFLVCKIFS